MATTYKAGQTQIAVGQVISFTTTTNSGNREIISKPYKGKIVCIDKGLVTLDCSTLYNSNIVTASVSWLSDVKVIK